MLDSQKLVGSGPVHWLRPSLGGLPRRPWSPICQWLHTFMISTLVPCYFRVNLNGSQLLIRLGNAGIDNRKVDTILQRIHTNYKYKHHTAIQGFRILTLKRHIRHALYGCRHVQRYQLGRFISRRVSVASSHEPPKLAFCRYRQGKLVYNKKVQRYTRSHT